jgi:quercetin dioxygenase-like cupin family protein
MTGKFISSTEVKREELEWGSLAWFSSPAASSSKDLVVLEVTLRPAGGHNFHRHPNQEELIYVIEGEIEQWVGQEKRVLRPGDSAFIGADVVHASFNVSDRNAKLLAILGPCVGSEGYELVDVAGEEPWVSLRNRRDFVHAQRTVNQ